ncbi:hypothetical protein BGZ63DRAFT_421993 [Mariannaea sp. PMI_226]|jgi:hypothetical protein|nr:hypothetical protein BGZ63DRAFT_421993 [Mariannaea sp. PMI_226]
MQSKIVLATTLLAAVVSADNFMLHPQARRDLEARATSTTDDALSCANAILSVYSDVPTPPADIVSDLLDNPQTDPCHFTIPASLSKEYSSYSKEVMSWYDDHSKAIESALSQCPSASSYANMVPSCTDKGDSSKPTDDSSQSTGTVDSSNADSTKGSSDSSKTDSADSSKSTGGAAQQTAVAAAAMAVAGIAAVLL